jgi:hypothetical protein
LKDVLSAMWMKGRSGKRENSEERAARIGERDWGGLKGTSEKEKGRDQIVTLPMKKASRWPSI